MRQLISKGLLTLILLVAQLSVRAAAGDVVFQETFDSQQGFNRFTVLDLNKDGDTWLWGASKGGFSANNFWATYMYSSQKQGNDWMLTPELQLQAGTIYKLQFRMRPAGSDSYTEVIAIAYGQGSDPTAYQLLQDEMLVPAGDWKDYSYMAVPKTDGKYRFGFQALSPADQYAIYVDDVIITEQTSAATPAAVTGLVATPGAQGALQATLSFTLPLLQADGQPLSELTQVEILRDAQPIATLTEGLAPGAVLSYVDPSPQNGLHEYAVVAHNAGGAGMQAKAECYVGEDMPVEVTGVTLIDHIDHYTLSWKAPSRGANGYYFDPSHVTYSVYLPNGYQADILMGSGLTTTTLDLDTIGGEQTLTRFRVKAVNTAGESDFANSNVICVGTPYTLPITESFAGGKTNPEHYWWLDASRYYENYWHTNTTGSSDNDGGCMVWVPYDYYDEAWLNTGKIDLSQTVNPRLSFDYNIKRNASARIQIEAVDNLQQSTTLGYVDGKTTGKSGWQHAEFSLAELRNRPYVMIKFHGLPDNDSENQELLALDNVKLLDVVDHNLAASLQAPAMAVAGKLTDVDVLVHNFGRQAESGYHVRLFAKDQLVADSLVNQPLAALADTTVRLQFMAPSGWRSVQVYADVKLEGDQVPDDNRTKTEKIDIMTINVKTVTDLQATDMAQGQGVQLQWTRPQLQSQTVTDDFEAYQPWLTEGVGQWTMADLDDAWSLGLGNYTFPGMEDAYAYIVFNRNKLDISPYAEQGTGPASEIKWIEAHSGEQYMAAFAPKEDMGVDTADDWLVSPQLNGEAQTVSFWAKSLANNGWEHYQVLCSMSDQRPESFRVVKAGRVETTSWTEIRADLPAGALYFAIRHLTPTDLGYGLFVDDVTYTCGDGEVLAYNVYRDGVLLTTLPADATTFADPEGTPSSKYQLSVVYHAGESPLSAEANTLGIASLPAAATRVVATFGLNGMPAKANGRGVVLQRMSDGSVVKKMK